MRSEVSLRSPSRRDMLKAAAGFVASSGTAGAATRPSTSAPRKRIEVPDALIVEGYREAASRNVLAALNPRVFFGYWSVCADGKDFGYGNTYPSLDGHQMADALLWLGKVDEVKANWDYVRSFQRPNGHLPIAILPGMKEVAGTPVDANGGFYTHWVPGDPLRALGSTTYVQNADVLFRYTQDTAWLKGQMASVNLAADFLVGLTTPDGLVGGAGYYVERPTRIEYDGVTQCHAVDAFRRAAALNRRVDDRRTATKYERLADRIAACYRTTFWVKDHFAEYVHPQRGLIDRHGLTDSNWSALATGVASPEQRAALWPLLRREERFYYGGMPTGIATRPDSYEPWEFTHSDKQDLAAMGRVWYLEAWARARMGDGEGLIDGIRRVCKAGREGGYYWRERYGTDAGGASRPFGANKYCEYPLGVDSQPDGTLTLAPTVPAGYWDAGFGQTLSWREKVLTYRMHRSGTTGSYRGKAPQRLSIRLPVQSQGTSFHYAVNGRSGGVVRGGDRIVIVLPAAQEPCHFELLQERL